MVIAATMSLAILRPFDTLPRATAFVVRRRADNAASAARRLVC